MPWCTIRTRPLPSAVQAAECIRAISRANYGRAVAEAEADLLAIGGWNRQARDESFGRTRKSDGGTS